jgi:hypothetical protein
MSVTSRSLLSLHNVLVLACALLAVRSVAAPGVEVLYHFTDEYGVPHFSNQPLDPRYRPLSAVGEPSQPQAEPQAGAEVSITGPDHAKLGDTFEVTVSMAAPQPGTGQLELTFDPEAIALQAISVEASVTEPGKVRIDLNLVPGQREQTLANLSFQAVAHHPTQASIQITQVEMFKPDGTALPTSPGGWMTVTLVE